MVLRVDRKRAVGVTRDALDYVDSIASAGL
jgi:hypothetical protein